MKKMGKKFGKMSKLEGGIIIALAVFASSLTVYVYVERQVQYMDRPYERVESSYLYSDWEQDC